MPSIEDKLMTASQIKEVTDTKLDKDFSSLDTSGGFSLTDELAVNISGSPYRITGRTLANAIGGGGTEQAALTNYVKNCGTISSLPASFTDSNITADMIVIEYTVGDESAVGSDWTVTTSDGSFTIAGTLAKSTSLSIVFGVGYSTTPSILTNLASDSPDNILKASPRPGVTGVLPLVNGGVGSSTAAGARTNLDVYSKSETNTAIQQSTAKGDTAFDAITRSDATDITTFADTVEAGKIQFFRNRASEPTSAWNYSPGIVLRPTSSQTVVVLFGLRVNSIAMLRKDGGTWASDWTIIS